MPELPDVTVYVEALEQRIGGQRLERLGIASPFLLRTAMPPVQTVVGKSVTAVRRIGKRIAIGLEDELWLVFHLMIAGRLHWFAQGAPVAKRAQQLVARVCECPAHRATLAAPPSPTSPLPTSSPPTPPPRSP